MNPVHCELIEVESSSAENSDYSTDGSQRTDTTSLTSTINEYLVENGRKYHIYYGVDKNLQPTDETEQERLDLQHEMACLVLKGKLHRAPVGEVHRCLDIGTGTGIWAIDFADQHPETEVIGTDISPIQPNWVPANCRFELDDCERRWTYNDNTFDFIHARNLLQSIADWPKVLAEVLRCLKPGGYFECADVSSTILSDDGTLKPDNPMKIWFDTFNKSMNAIGRPSEDPEITASRLKAAGFMDVYAFKAKLPFGIWPKDSRLKQVGAMALLSAESRGFQAYGMAAFTRVLGMDSAEAERICVQAEKAMFDKRVHSYSHFHSVYGRKPVGQREEASEDKR